LGEYFAVHFGDQVVLAISIVAPNLPELDGIYGHDELS
jgi:hypothetical protein